MAQTKAIVNKLLTNVSNGLFPKGYIADKVFPKISVKQTTGIIGAYGSGHLRTNDDLIGGRAEARRADPISRKIDVLYNIKTHALEGVVTQNDYDNVEQPFEAESDETLGLTHLILTNKEKSVADQLFSTSVITNNSSPTDKFDDYTGDPTESFRVAQNAILSNCGVMPNAVIMSQLVFNALQYHPAILDHLGFKYNQMGLLSQSDIMKALNVSELLIADAPYNSAKEGQADVLSQIWSDGLLYYVKPASAAKYQISLGYEMNLSSSKGREVFKYPLNNPPGANGIIVQDAYEHKIVNVGAGYLLSDVLS